MSGPRAYPNAYVSTDEPPRKPLLTRALGAVAAAGVGYLGLVILLLSLFSSVYSPVTQVASDYGVGTYAPEMNSGFFLAGVGMLSLAVAVFTTSMGRAEKAGAAFLILAGIDLLVDSFFSTDIEGAAATLHGTVHAVAGVAFFISASIGILLVTEGLGRRGFVVTTLAVAVGLVFLILNVALSLDANGLAERIIILVVFTSSIATSVRVYRLP
jgi:hypothetical membrane protein